MGTAGAATSAAPAGRRPRGSRFEAVYRRVIASSRPGTATRCQPPVRLGLNAYIAVEASAPAVRIPTTSPAEGSGEPSGFPSGEPEGRSPSDRRDAVHQGGVRLSDKCVRMKPAGSVRGGAPQICEMPISGEVFPYACGACSDGLGRALCSRGGAPHTRGRGQPRHPARGVAPPWTPACGASGDSGAPGRMPFGGAHAQ
jgi:hypothetical protein